MKKNFTVESVGTFVTDVTIIVTTNMSYGHDYIKINADIDTTNFKIKSFSYCILVSKEDSGIRWINRDSAVDRIGMGAVVAGERQILDNLYNLKTLAKAGKKHPAFSHMNDLFNKYVNHFHTDFTYHDMIALGAYPKKMFFWCVRDCGTDMFFEVDSWMGACIDGGDMSRKWFFWNGYTLESLSGNIRSELERVLS
jgi:hypothetical protein